MHDETRLLEALDALGIAYETVPHDAVFTVEESEGLHAAIPGLHTRTCSSRTRTGASGW